MPELPEVETIKNAISPLIINKVVLSVEIIREKTVLNDIDIFKKMLINERFIYLSRKGKFLIFHLTNDRVLITHFRMEGKFYFKSEEESNSKYPKVIFHLSDNKKLIFDDSRCFGIMKLSDEGNYLNEKELKHLGPEPSEVEDVDILYKKSRNISKAIKTTLLDQTFLAGLGNIYADETLFACKIHPNTKTNSLTKKDFENLVKEAKRILDLSIKYNGSTIRTFAFNNDSHGEAQNFLQVYGKRDLLCPNCSSKFHYIKVNGRGTTFCPICQRKDGNLKIAITGPSGSGKSTVLNVFKKRGHFTFSCDEYVNILYSDSKFIEKVNSTLSIKFPKYIDKNILREHLLENPVEKTKLEKLVWDNLKHEIEVLFKKTKEPLQIYEVPLLYESKMESYFDLILIITSNRNEEFLSNRTGFDTSKKLLKLNKRVLSLKHLKDADYIIKNNNSKIDLEKDVNYLIDRLEYLQNQ